MKIKLTSTFLVAILFSLYAYSDVIPENSHYVTKCIKITNANSSKDFTVFGYYLELGHGDRTYIIDSTTCLHKGYKFNEFKLFAANSQMLAKQNEESINIKESNALESNIELEPYYGYIDNSNPLDAIYEYYTIAGFTNESIVIYLSKKITSYNDGTPDKTETFTYTGDESELLKSIPLSNKEYLNNSEIEILCNLQDKSSKICLPDNYSGEVKVDIFNINGSLLYSKKHNTNNSYLNLSINSISNGIHLFKISHNNKVVTKKVYVF